MFAMFADPQMFNNGGILAAIIGFYFVFFIIFMAIVIIPFWFILKKAGFSPWLSLINLVPLGTLILLYVVAFAEWKVIPAPQVAWNAPPFPPQPPYPPQA
jgi:hypothetical protein